MTYDPFSGRNALIYGAASGIGRSVAFEFARRGAAVAIADLDVDAARQTAADLEDVGARAFAVRCDVSSDESVRTAGDAAEAALGPMDIVMNNVGAILLGNPEDIPVAEWERMMSLNFMGAVRAQTVFLPRMIARGRGHLVNTATFAGLYPFATSRMPYVASKAALIALTESLAIYLIPQGIRVSCLCPGPVLSTIADPGKMKTWSPDAIMRGPGSDLPLKTPEMAATILADGMAAERVIIPTDERAFDWVREHGDNPDAFIHAKIAQFAAGDSGRPYIPDDLKHLIPPAHRR